LRKSWMRWRRKRSRRWYGVVPDPHKDIGLNILSQFHYGPQIKLATFESLAEALSALIDEEI
jgi:hypothetical protein